MRLPTTTLTTKTMIVIRIVFCRLGQVTLPTSARTSVKNAKMLLTRGRFYHKAARDVKGVRYD